MLLLYGTSNPLADNLGKEGSSLHPQSSPNRRLKAINQASFKLAFSL
jgi:hypothetical protein